jgi:hypothetical protein
MRNYNNSGKITESASIEPASHHHREAVTGPISQEITGTEVIAE